ncbi:MAG: hypothetical protein AAF682_23475 [Planctomycetota bacterium]
MKALTCSLAGVSALLLAFSTSAPTADAAAPQSGCPGPVLGDLDGDGSVQVVDLVNFNAAWNAGSLDADLNNNCFTDVGDIVLMYQYYYPAGNATIADFDVDGDVDCDDVNAYLQAYLAGDTRANVDGDCDLDNNDVQVWETAWNACQTCI